MSNEALGKIFHEPNRLSIMSIVCAAEKGLSFSEIKKECDLTDGNLNRHLKVLKEAEVIEIKKSFINDKPRTTVFITEMGLERFNEYLVALSDIIEQAKNALPNKKKLQGTGILGTLGVKV